MRSKPWWIALACAPLVQVHRTLTYAAGSDYVSPDCQLFDLYPLLHEPNKRGSVTVMYLVRP